MPLLLATWARRSRNSSFPSAYRYHWLRTCCGRGWLTPRAYLRSSDEQSDGSSLEPPTVEVEAYALRGHQRSNSNCGGDLLGSVERTTAQAFQELATYREA